MAANKVVTLGPIYLSSTLTTDILSPKTLTGGTTPANTSSPLVNTFYNIKHIHIANTSGSAATFTLYKDATGANTAGQELIGKGISVAANSVFDWYGSIRLGSDDSKAVIVGGSGTNNVLTIQFEAEVGIV